MITKIARTVLPALPTGIAFALARMLAEHPFRLRIHEQDAQLMRSARQFNFGSDYPKVGWTLGEGPLVILVHGWAGRASQMATIAHRLTGDGFKVALFDATAHGQSPGRSASFSRFADDIVEFSQFVDPDASAHAFVAHSAGALLTMASRSKGGPNASKYVCLNAPRAPYPPINAIRSMLNPSESVIDRFTEYYARNLGLPWVDLLTAMAFSPQTNEQLLLVYDTDDAQVHHSDGETIKKLWPDAQLLTTSGLGHIRSLRDESVLDRISTFLGRT